MYSLHIGAENLDGVNWVSFAIENEISEVEVNALVVQPNVLNGADESEGVSCPVS